MGCQEGRSHGITKGILGGEVMILYCNLVSASIEQAGNPFWPGE